MADEFKLLTDKDLTGLLAPDLVTAYKSLRFEFEEVEKAYDSAEKDIQDLERELAASKGSKSKKGGKAAGDYNEEEIIRLSDRLAAQDSIIAEKQDRITELSQTVKSLNQELAEAKNIERKMSDTVETLQKEIANKASEGQQTRSQANDLKKQRLEALDENRRLHEENTKLQDSVENLEKAVGLLSDQNDRMTLHISELTEKHDFLQENKDDHETRQEELEVQLKEMTDRLERVQEELLAAQDDGEWLAQIENLKKNLKQSQDKGAADSKAAKAEITALQEKVKALSNDTLIGKKVKELETQQAALKENLQLIDDMAKQLSAAEKSRAEAVESLRKVEESIEQRVAERVLAEREKNRNLERTLAGLVSRTSDESDKYRALEKENTELHRQVDELSNWKVIYENGHGMQGLARDQKKIKDENRRLNVSMEQMTAKLGAVMDANGMLAHSFEKLKIECGKPPSFCYPEYQLSEEMKTENARLQSQMNEVEDQLGALELENTRLRKALKTQAGSVGEAGFKFAGLSPDQLVKVNEFAVNLRDGRVELPMDDRSAKLLKENKRLREEREGLQMQIQGYERQLLGGAGLPAARGGAVLTDPSMTRAQEAELSGLREDVRKLLSENSDLREKMVVMQNEVLLLLRQSAGKSESRTEDIEAMLLAHNEQLSRQMRELKQQTMSGIQLTTQQIEQQQNAASKAAEMDKSKGSGKQPPHGKTPAPTQPQASKAPKQQTPATVAVPPAGPHFAQTPAAGVGTGMTMTVPAGFFAAPMTHAYAGPGTPHGKALLGKTLTQLNLPPEEWAEEVKDINGQLVECLEQLFERERELEESHSVVAGLEDSLVAIKQQMAAIYYDFAMRADSWEAKEKEFKAANLALHNERDDLALKVKRMQEMIATTRSEDPKTIEDKLMEVSRKLTIYEVNEAVLARKYTTQAEQLASEQQARERLEDSFVEMESLLKKRILYLEQHKLSASSRLAHLQAKVDSSVPQGDYLELQTELECLREEHLKALRREVDARVSALKSKDQATELRTLRVSMAHMEASLAAARSSAFNLSGQLEHQKEFTTRALAASGQKASSELSSIISEMAKYRGETGRLEVELAAASRRAEALTDQMKAVSGEAASMQLKLAELEQREEDASARESAMRKAKLEIEIAFKGGLQRDEADSLRAKLGKASRDLEESNREAGRQKELAEIASLQAQTIGNFRSAHAEELGELREHCLRLESRSDDDILIGKLQRQLMSTRASYKAFVQKYQHLRSNMRQRELAVRTLETRLDQREETVLKMQEAHRLQVQALKAALRSVQNAIEDDSVPVSDIKNNSASGKGKNKNKGRAGVKFVSIGDKLMSMSSRVQTLAELAEQAMKKAATAESENLTMEGMLQDLQAEKDLLAAQTRDLEALHRGGKGKQQAVAARLVSLSEDVRVNKLACLQQRRQIQVLRAEKKHLQQVIAGIEADMETLEEGKVLAETKHLLGALSTDESSRRLGGDGVGSNTDLGAPEDLKGLRLSVGDLPISSDKSSTKTSSKPKLVVEVESDGPGGSDPELMERIEVLSSQLTTASKEASSMRLAADRFKDQVTFLQQALQEKDGQVQYYERVARQEGLPLIGSAATALPHVHAGGEAVNSRQLRQAKDEHSKLQEAAQATITSLKGLLEEKNRLLDQYRRKVEDLGGEKRTKSRADKKADELLQRLNESEGRGGGSPTKRPRGLAADGEDMPQAHRQLLEQVEQADAILQEKDRLVNQLEQRLSQQTNQRERAEVRCGSAIKEMEAMKSDMVTLAQQLQVAEERLRRMSGRPIGSADPGDKRVNELTKALKTKDEKVRGYREIIIRLKEEFIKAEEERAIAAVSAAQSKGGPSSSSGPTLGADEVKDLKSQISALRDGLRQAKDDLEAARKTRERLGAARQAAQEESERLEQAVGRAEASAATAQDSLLRCRKDLEESRRKENRMRDRLKELLEQEGASDKIKDLRAANEKLSALERELEVSRAQNLALRKAHEEGPSAGGAGTGSPSPMRGTATNARSSTNAAAGPGTGTTSSSRPGSTAVGGSNRPGGFPAGPGTDTVGHTLGLGEGPQDELRAQLHTKWENEKKLQKRIMVVEKRLQEKLEENEELQNQLKRARDATQQAIAAKDDAVKRAGQTGGAGATGTGASGKSAHHTAAGKQSMDEVVAAEEASRRIFALEDQLAVLKRKADVEQPNEIAALRHRLAVQQAKVGELEAELEESTERRKRAAAGSAGGAQAKSSLRDSEDRYLREERLKDDLEIARRQKLELEAALLDRDARAIEHRFDLESKDVEAERLRKRIRELENAYRSAAAASGAKLTSGLSGLDSAGVGATKGGGSSSAAQRERDLEGVIEAMKRVVDKLKAENDRLKKATGGDAKAADAEKKLAAEKKRADKAEEELKGMGAKLKGHEESSQKLMQKQEQLTKLRKQLKQREDELAAVQADGSHTADEIDNLKRKLSSKEERIQQLETSLQQADSKASRAAASAAGAGGGSSKEADILRREVDAVRSELAASQRRLAELEAASASNTGAGGGGGVHAAQLQAELRQLRDENKNLRQELSAFDLDFFEEIEDLKLAHAEAVSKLKIYERGGR